MSIFVSSLENIKIKRVKNAQSFHLQRRLKSLNVSLISLIFLS